MAMLSSMSLLVFAGLLGFAAYAVSFALVQIGRMDGNSLTYTLCNITAASLVLVSMFDQFNLGSLLTQLTWIGVGVVGVGRRLLDVHSIESNETITQQEVVSPR